MLQLNANLHSQHNGRFHKATLTPKPTIELVYLPKLNFAHTKKTKSCKDRLHKIPHTTFGYFYLIGE